MMSSSLSCGLGRHLLSLATARNQAGITAAATATARRGVASSNISRTPQQVTGTLHFGHNSISLLPTSSSARNLILPSRPLSGTGCLASKDEAKAAEADAAASKPEEGEATSASSEVEAQLKQQVEQLQSKHDDLFDKYRRSLAESDNMRKRLTKQIEEGKQFGIQSFCKDLLEVADVLGKAASAEGVPKEVLEGEDSKYLKEMHRGLELTESQLQQVFRRHGLEKVNPATGEKFDPNIHEALFQVPAPAGIEAGSVVDVQKVGYSLHGRTVRPALVGVAKK